MPRGGARKNSGQRSAADTMNTRSLAQAALISRYGTLEKAMKELLDSKEASLIKFVYEHALGKPVDKVEAKVEGEVIHIRFKDAE